MKEGRKVSFVKITAQSAFVKEGTDVELNLVLNSVSCNFIKKEILTQMFSHELCETFKNTFLWNTSGGCF